MPKFKKTLSHVIAAQETTNRTGAQILKAKHDLIVARVAAKKAARLAKIESTAIGNTTIVEETPLVPNPSPSRHMGLSLITDLIAHPPIEKILLVTKIKRLYLSLPAPRIQAPLKTEMTVNACWGHRLLENKRLAKDADAHVKSLLKERMSEYKWLWPFLDSELLYHCDFSHCDTTKYGGDILWSNLNVDTILECQVQMTNTVIEAFMGLLSDYQWKELRSRMSHSKREVCYLFTANNNVVKVYCCAVKYYFSAAIYYSICISIKYYNITSIIYVFFKTLRLLFPPHFGQPLLNWVRMVIPIPTSELTVFFGSGLITRYWISIPK